MKTMKVKTCPVSELFEVKYGVNLELNALIQDSEGINFVSRTSKNNGVSAKVKPLPDVEPLPAGTITVAGGGSVMETFLQLAPYYSGRDLYYLTPKIELSNEVKLYYCMCLRNNKYKFSYGRQANTTLPDLLIPSLDSIPDFVRNFSIKNYGTELLKQIDLPQTHIGYKKSEEIVPLSRLFNVENGISSSSVLKKDFRENENWIPYIRPSYRQQTSISGFVNKQIIPKDKIYPKGSLYVSTNGQGSHTFSYVSVFEFVPNSDVSVLIPKRLMSLQEKLYYSYCITKNRYKFSYGRKPKGKRLEAILLPEFPPDYVYPYNIENVISSFSEVLESV